MNSMRFIYVVVILLVLGCTSVYTINNETDAFEFAKNNNDFSKFLSYDSVKFENAEISYINASEKTRNMIEQLNVAYSYGINDNTVSSYTKNLKNNIDMINRAGNYWSVSVSEKKCTIYFSENGTIIYYSFIRGFNSEEKFHCYL